MPRTVPTQRRHGAPHRAAATLVVAVVLALAGTAVADVGVGLRLVDQGDFDGAIAAFEAAVASDASGLFRHDVPWIAGGRGGLVISSFERAIAIEPDEITHRLAFARVLVDRGDEARALEHLRVAVTLRASTYLDRQDLQAARALLTELE